MRREPSNFRIHGRIERIGSRKYVVIVTLEPDDPAARGARSIETHTTRSREEAVKKQFEMIRQASAALKARGDHVVDVQAES